MLDRVKATERQPGVDEILLPGERGARLAAQRAASGLLPLEVNLFTALKAMADKYDAGAVTQVGCNGRKTAAVGLFNFVSVFG